MLSIGKVGLGRSQQLYYEQQVASGVEDYYAGRGEAPGRWTGSGAKLLGLEGELDADQLTALMDGRDPATGTQLARRSGRCSTAALDLTFSAPKSVSVLFAIGDGRLSDELVAAHEEAVDAALAYMEREACRVRRGHNGTQEERDAGNPRGWERARSEPAAGFVAAAYRHRMSRAQDPQLHTHVVCANMAPGRDGRWTALDGRAIYEHAKAAGCVYEAHLRHAVTERVPWASWGTVREGIAELDQVPDPVRKEFSQRRRRILERARELEAVGVTVGRAGRERIVYDTREAKREVVEADWRAESRARAAEHGLGRAELDRFARLSPRPLRHASPVAHLARDLFSATGLTARQNTFVERELIIGLAAAHQHGLPGEDLAGLARRLLEDAQVVSLHSGLDRRYTTRELLRAEAVIVGHAEAGHGQSDATVGELEVSQALEALPVRLSEEQAAVVAGIAASGNRIDVVEALAGTGKTTSAAALREVYERTGYRVLGAAPTARAARELADRAGIREARTLDSWALRLAADPDALRAAGPAVMVIDEAGMANTRVSAQVIDRAMAADVKVVAIGDSGQLSSVQAGGWLGATSRRLGSFELREVMRQNDPAERRALAKLHRGQPGPYLKLKQARGDLSVFSGEEPGVEAERRLVARWTAVALEYGESEAVMICRDNRRRERLNHQARDALRWLGDLGPDVEIAGRRWAVGDRVIARRNDRHRDLDNGMRATITHLDEHHGATIRLDSGATRRLDPEYLSGHVEHAYALTGHGMQGATVTWAGVIGQPHDFSRNWAYTALSRAREPVELYLIDEPHQIEQEREGIAPSRRARADEPLERMARRMRERDDEDLALERLERPGPRPQQRRRDSADAAVAFVSPARARLYELERQLQEIHEQLRALPIHEAEGIERITKAMASIEIEAEHDPRAWSWSERRDRKLRQRDREYSLQWLRDQRAELIERTPSWQATLDRSEQLSTQQRAVAREHLRLRGQAITEELASHPPWLEHTLGPEPPDHAFDQDRWQRTAREIAGHRIDHHITDPEKAIDERSRELALTRASSETRVALGLDTPEHGYDHGYEM